MKVLHIGTPPSEREYEGTCNHCHTSVSFKRSEGEVTRCQRDGDFVTVKCPVCGGKIHSLL